MIQSPGLQSLYNILILQSEDFNGFRTVFLAPNVLFILTASVYCVCGSYIKAVFEDTVKGYLIENGTYEDGMYYIAEDAEYATFAACYVEKCAPFAYPGLAFADYSKVK